MALIVEDGTGIDNANGYIDEAYFIAYLTDRGRTPIITTVPIEAAIVSATDFVEAKWLTGRLSVLGAPVSETQGLSLPSAFCPIDAGERATLVFLNAIVLYAEYIAVLTNSFYSTQLETGPVKVLESKVGPIEEKTEYDTARATSGGTFQKVPDADLLIKRFLGISTSNQLIRN